MRLMRHLIVHRNSQISPERQVFRFWLHFPVGLLIMLAAWLGWQYGVICAGMFLFYEVNEDGHISDQAWIDTKGALAAVFVCVIGGAAWKLWD